MIAQHPQLYIESPGGGYHGRADTLRARSGSGGGRRLSAVLKAGTGWDPLAVLAGEAEAHGLLYSGLDLDQQRTYHLLVREGILDVGLDCRPRAARLAALPSMPGRLNLRELSRGPHLCAALAVPAGQHGRQGVRSVPELPLSVVAQH
ncbi:MAG: DUF6400 family protein [Pseudonocardia sp.]